MKTVDVYVGGDVVNIAGQPNVDPAGMLRITNSTYQEVARFEPGKWSGYVIAGVEPQAMPTACPPPVHKDDIPF